MAYFDTDLPLVSGNSGSNSGFGNGNDAWVLIILFALIFGWGRNGNGGGVFGGGSGIGENYVLATDFATIERKLDSVNAGICDSTYALNNTIVNGFANTQSTLCNGFSGINTAILQSSFNTERGLNGISSQIVDCCCKTQKELLENRYLDAQNTCAITNAMAMNTRDIIDNQNANYRAIHEELIANKIEAKNERIAEQQAQIQALQLKASQETQNNFLISKLGTKCPEPAYIVPNPNCCYTYGVTNFGYGNNNCCTNVL